MKTVNVTRRRQPLKGAETRVESDQSSFPDRRLHKASKLDVTKFSDSKKRHHSQAAVDSRKAYSRPTAFLPLDSIVPSQSASSARMGFSNRPIQAALQVVQRESAKMNASLAHYVVDKAELNHSLQQLQATVERARNLLNGELALLAPHQQPAGASHVNEGSGDPIEDRSRDYIIYDEYFKVVRIPSMTREQFAAQVVATCGAILRDLPFVVLGMDQILALTETIEAMFQFLAHSFDSQDAEDCEPEDSEFAMSEDSRDQAFWRKRPVTCSTDADERTGRVAFYRWSVGHHFFNLSSIFCASHLDMAARAVEAGDEGNSAESISKATQYLRGVTGAMFYAANFPGEVYRSVIRPSMVVTGAPHGFSGSQNADYNNLKAAKSNLIERISKTYGADAGQWPAPLLSVVRAFHELDVQDSEHHVLLAAYKVGGDSSLAQKTWHGRLPAGARVRNAVDILRDMAEHKRRQYEF